MGSIEKTSKKKQVQPSLHLQKSIASPCTTATVIHESHSFRKNRVKATVMTIFPRLRACYSLMARVLYHSAAANVNAFSGALPLGQLA
jgi:hypothetical protein